MKPLEAWEALLRQAVAKDFDEQQQALFQIGLILERHSRPNSDAGTLYEDNLARELLRLALDDTRQSAAVLYLATLARNQPEQAKSFIYAFGRAKPDVVIAPLLQLMLERGKTFAPDAAYQVVIALESCVKTGSDTVKAALQAHDPSDLLDEWAELKDTLLADKADYVLEKIEALLKSGGDA